MASHRRPLAIRPASPLSPPTSVRPCHLRQARFLMLQEGAELDGASGPWLGPSPTSDAEGAEFAHVPRVTAFGSKAVRRTRFAQLARFMRTNILAAQGDRQRQRGREAEGEWERGIEGESASASWGLCHARGPRGATRCWSA